VIGAVAEALELLSAVGEESAAAEASSGGFLDNLFDMSLPLPLKKSTCVASARYTISSGELEITFTGGNTSTYEDISIVTILHWLVSESVGEYYNSSIKGSGTAHGHYRW
jgi:hypothetical protein